MVETQFFYRKDTKQIDAVYRDCTTTSAVFKDPATYMEVNVVDPPYEVTRDHKVVLDADGNVIDTEPSPNPVQPVVVIEMPPNPGYGKIIGADIGAVKPLHVRRTYLGKDFDFWCYATQDIVDAYRAGVLAVGDIVTVFFIDDDLKKAVAAQKVYKTW